MLGKPVLTDGGFAPRQLQIGDVMAGADFIPATIATATNLPITGVMLLGKYILRNPAGISNENIDTAANLLAAFVAASAVPSPSSIGRIQDGTSFIVRWILTTANALTVAAVANTGVTVTRGTVAASTSKDFLVTIRNGTPAQTFSGVTVNASAVVTLTVAQASVLTPGMIVTNAVAGLQGTTIIGVNIQAGTVTMSGNANASNPLPGVAISFSPVVLVEGLAG